MQLELVDAANEFTSLANVVADTVYAETGAKSLRVVEAMCSMIYNAADQKAENIKRVISDSKLFTHIKPDSVIDITSRGYQMCMRVARQMLRGNLSDKCNHATKFHHADKIPDWAVARGYVADIDDILFYA